VPKGEGVRLTGRWSWATGDIAIEDVWHSDGMRATGSNDVVITDVLVPGHRLVRVSDLYTGTAPGAGLHDADTYRWRWCPLCPVCGDARAR
jgi:alkylation response protein AidB-like acyl-CoA dehydrogenase